MIPRFGQLKDGTPWSKYQIKNVKKIRKDFLNF